MSNKNIDVLNPKEFNKLPEATRRQIIEELHERLLEASMMGYIEVLLAQRAAGDDLTSRCVFICGTSEAGFPVDMRANGKEYHREQIDLSSPPTWVQEIEMVARAMRNIVRVGKPRSTWLTKDGKDEMRDADTWGITFMGGNAVLHAIDLDVMNEHVQERVRRKLEAEAKNAPANDNDR
jgi:hypothetical protein